MIVYIAGPMTGLPEYNYPAFHAAAAHARTLGYEVINPADNFDGDTTLPWATYLRQALRQVLDADAIVVLPGWESSKGAQLETHVARTLAMPVIELAALRRATLSLSHR